MVLQPPPRPAPAADRSPRSRLQEWQLKPRKALGQNFLADPGMAEKIVERLGLEGGEAVLEIGPGLGALTLPLARRLQRLVAVELDRQLAPRLQALLAERGLTQVQILQGDILRTDLAALARAQGAPLLVVGNLPYHISSPLLLKLIEARGAVTRAVLMFQRELAERLCAAPGGGAYGRITVRLRYCAEVRPLISVSARCFHPRPAVDSQVIEIRFHPRPPIPAADEALFAATVQAAFAHRRKTLRNALRSGSWSPFRIEMALDRAGIDPLRRAETLTVAEFVHLAARLGAPEATVSG
jgi:16S rRNA (adenine1518-N6/adenine1519-N6)-dimethyltransferase